MSEVLANAVFNPADYLEVYHNGTNLIGIKSADLLLASHDSTITSAPRKTLRQLSGSDQVVPADFFGQHSTANGIPNWTGKLLKIGDLSMNWRHITPAGSLAVTFSGQNVTWTAHGRAVGSMVAFFAPADSTVATAGVLPTGITANTPYFVVATPDANTIQVSATAGGTAITFSGSPTNCGVMGFDSAKLTSFDAVVDAAVTAGKELVYQSHDTPTWASSDGASTNKRPKGYKAFATFLKVLHSRVTAAGNAYSATLKHLEGWNEPNTASSFSGTQYSSGGVAGVAFTPNAGAGSLVTWTAHSFPVGYPVQVEANGGTLPAGLAENTPYYVIASGYTSGQFRISSTWSEDGSAARTEFVDNGTGWRIRGCDLTTHQAWVYHAAKACSPAVDVLTAAYTGAPGVTGASGQTLLAYRGARANSTRYEVTESIYLTATDGKVHIYRCSTAGITAGAQPTYAGTSAEAITDGTAVFTEVSISTSSLAGWLITNGAILGSFCDKIGIHFYQGMPDFFSFDWRAVDAVMMAQAAYGMTAKPVWCTEFGISGPVEESDLWRMYLYSIGMGIAAFIYYDWDTGSGTSTGLGSMRLVDSALDDTYNEIAQRLTGATINFVNCNNWTGQVGASINGTAEAF